MNKAVSNPLSKQLNSLKKPALENLSPVKTEIKTQKKKKKSLKKKL